MAFYDYKCPSCNFILTDVFKRITDDTSTHACPKCGSNMKIYYNSKSSPSFELKGKGWYKTDYKSKK